MGMSQQTCSSLVDLGYSEFVKPEHYNLSIDLDSELDKFSGQVDIKIQVEKEIEKFIVNAAEMDITEVKIDGENVKFDSREDENLTIHTSLSPGTYTLSITFKADINTRNEGFYLSKYDNKKMYSTHFEPTDARKAFPCFDHPAMKATYDISITSDEKYTILSNMGVSKTSINNQKKTVVFNRMPKVSTYLIAYVVGELYSISDGRVSVYATRGPEHGRYALDIANRVLSFFESYFNIPYPLEKLDMVGVPDFSMGAMENWGLVTYRETSLLFDKKKASMHQRRLIAETVAHELAHQWFGNLVTPVWWDDLWLNEGFATWAAALGCEALRQEELNDKNIKPLIDWKPWLTFINDDLNHGLEADILESSHPIKIPVHHPHEVNQIFDGISYSKSASLIRMVENYLTPEVFQKKISEYLKHFAWKNATSEDLFNYLGSESENDINALMNIWTSKTGFPLISLKNNKLSQTRMLLDNDNNEASDWPVPLRVKIGDETKMIDFLTEYDLTPHITGDKSVLLNAGGYGFYRSHYTDTQLDVSSLDAVDRLVYVNDQVALATSRRIKLSKMLDMCREFTTENDPEILGSVSGFLLEYKHVLYDNNDEIINIIKSLVEDRLDFSLKEEVSFDEMKLRAILVSMAVAHCVPIQLDSNVHPMYLNSYYLQDFQSHNDLEKYLEMYKSSTSEIQSRLLNAIALTKDLDTYKQVIQLLLSGEVKNQDKARLAISLLGNLQYKEYFIHYFEDNFQQLEKKISAASMMYIIERTASWSRNVDHFKSKLSGYDLTQFMQPYQRGLETAKFRIKYREMVSRGML